MNTIIFDGNFILMRSAHTLHRLNMLYSSLWDVLDKTIEKYMTMNSWEHVIIVSDSRKKSWRLKYLDKYKGTREKSEDIDWEYVFKTYSEWKESIKEKYTVLEYDHIEGDDWVTSTIAYMNKQNKSCVIIASDTDFYQLLNYKANGKNSWINIQIFDILGKEKVILPVGWELWLKEFEENSGNDVFALDNSIKNITFFKNIINMWETVEVDCYQKLFEKIIQGDKSDNISSIYQKVTSTGKLQNIGASTANKIWNFYKNNYNTHFKVNETFVEDLIDSFEKVQNLELSKEIRNSVRKNVNLNIKLIQLNYKNFPEEILEQILDVLQENF